MPDPRDIMFHTTIDQNGVEVSRNCHSAESYSHPAAEQLPACPHWMAGNGDSGPRGGYLEPPAENLVHKTKDRMLERLGRPGAGMTFEGDLLPRAERVSPTPRPTEHHAANCWCDWCQSSRSNSALPSPRPY